MNFVFIYFLILIYGISNTFEDDVHTTSEEHFGPEDHFDPEDYFYEPVKSHKFTLNNYPNWDKFLSAKPSKTNPIEPTDHCSTFLCVHSGYSALGKKRIYEFVNAARDSYANGRYYWSSDDIGWKAAGRNPEIKSFGNLFHAMWDENLAAYAQQKSALCPTGQDPTIYTVLQDDGPLDSSWHENPEWYPKGSTCDVEIYEYVVNRSTYDFVDCSDKLVKPKIIHVRTYINNETELLLHTASYGVGCGFVARFTETEVHQHLVCYYCPSNTRFQKELPKGKYLPVPGYPCDNCTNIFEINDVRCTAFIDVNYTHGERFDHLCFTEKVPKRKLVSTTYADRCPCIENITGDFSEPDRFSIFGANGYVVIGFLVVILTIESAWVIISKIRSKRRKERRERREAELEEGGGGVASDGPSAKKDDVVTKLETGSIAAKKEAPGVTKSATSPTAAKNNATAPAVSKLETGSKAEKKEAPSVTKSAISPTSVKKEAHIFTKSDTSPTSAKKDAKITKLETDSIAVKKEAPTVSKLETGSTAEKKEAPALTKSAIAPTSANKEMPSVKKSATTPTPANAEDTKLEISSIAATKEAFAVTKSTTSPTSGKKDYAVPAVSEMETDSTAAKKEAPAVTKSTTNPTSAKKEVAITKL